jgi:dihydrolipoamide dehydrogenase
MVVGDITTGTELLVVGGGPGGYVAAIRAGQLDVEVTLVEADVVGGTCLNHGCVPSKALLTATGVAHRAGAAERMGVHADPDVDLKGMVGWKNRVVRRLTKGVESLLENAGVTIVEGRAELAGSNRARVVHGGDGQGSETLDFEAAILATGSRPVEVPPLPFDGERVISSREALALESVPDRLVVVGGGYIGMELATVYARAGSEVTVLEQLPEILPQFGDDVSELVRERAEDFGVTVYRGETAEGAETDGDEAPVVVTTTTGDGEEREYPADRALVAVGREPVTDTVGLDAVDVATDDAGAIVTDERMATSAEDIYAVGDVTGAPMLAHAAFAEGEVAAEAVAGEPTAFDAQAVPAAVFTEPEVATVGLTETEAADAGFDPVVGEMPMRASGRALSMDEREGFVRVVGDAESDFLLGACIVAPEASELIAEVSLAIEMGATLEDVASTIHVHPTLSEAVHEAAMAARDESIHI